jgi:hypothetical protein
MRCPRPKGKPKGKKETKRKRKIAGDNPKLMHKRSRKSPALKMST